MHKYLRIRAALLIVLICTVTLTARFAKAQDEAAAPKEGESPSTAALTGDDVKRLRGDIEVIRKSEVASVLKLSDEEGQRFWPVFDEYQKNLSRVKDRNGKLIADYIANSESITDEQASSMLTEFLKNKEAELRVRKSYAPEFEKVLPPKKVFLLYQVENRLDAGFTYELSSDIPLIR
jgi:hypothetical protein